MEDFHAVDSAASSSLRISLPFSYVPDNLGRHYHVSAGHCARKIERVEQPSRAAISADSRSDFSRGMRTCIPDRRAAIIFNQLGLLSLIMSPA